MSLLKGNYPIEPSKEPDEDLKEKAGDSILEKEYYRAALTKLGGSICFVMKAKTFLWTGDPDARKADEQPAAVDPSVSQEEGAIQGAKKK